MAALGCDWIGSETLVAFNRNVDRGFGGCLAGCFFVWDELLLDDLQGHCRH
jgi:hypothetical protein